ncbi:MAG: hypothetical protein WEA09_07005 [Gemmatimonadota bacterium]
MAGAEGALPKVEEAWNSWKAEAAVAESLPTEAVEAEEAVGDWSPFEEFGAEESAPSVQAHPEETSPPPEEAPTPATREIPATPPQGKPVVDSGVASGGASTQGAPVNPFARRDPHDRARRLARVLASDIVSYYGQRYTRALAAGTLKEEFEEEVQKSWSEYVDQVGLEMAESNSYFQEALNEVLARGERVF